MKKILIIEDDQIVANIYRNKLAVEGFQVEIARDGQAGLDMVQSFKPDIVLLDLVLPIIPGIELMKKIRLLPDLQQLPVIVFSNTYLTNMVQEAWKAGATKCLSKANCTPKQVIQVVRTTLGINGASGRQAASAAAPAPPGGRNAKADEADAEFQAELRSSFIVGLPASLAALRAALQGVIKAENEDAKIRELQELYRRTHGLTGNAGLTGMSAIAQMSDALEALLKELCEKPENVNASTMRTVASAIDFVGILLERGGALPRDLPPARVLVVDDEAIAVRAITYALQKAKLKSVGVEDPARALELIAHSRFDLIFLDIGMPGMDGFEVCSRIRAMPAYKKTPVVFVTSLNDFESRANSTMSGGNDFIAKPFLYMELAVKALLYVLRNQLEARR